MVYLVIKSHLHEWPIGTLLATSAICSIYSPGREQWIYFWPCLGEDWMVAFLRGRGGGWLADVAWTFIQRVRITQYLFRGVYDNKSINWQGSTHSKSNFVWLQRVSNSEVFSSTLARASWASCCSLAHELLKYFFNWTWNIEIAKIAAIDGMQLSFFLSLIRCVRQKSWHWTMEILPPSARQKDVRNSECDR